MNFCAFSGRRHDDPRSSLAAQAPFNRLGQTAAIGRDCLPVEALPLIRDPDLGDSVPHLEVDRNAIDSRVVGCINHRLRGSRHQSSAALIEAGFPHDDEVDGCRALCLDPRHSRFEGRGEQFEAFDGGLAE